MLPYPREKKHPNNIPPINLSPLNTRNSDPEKPCTNVLALGGGGGVQPKRKVISKTAELRYAQLREKSDEPPFKCIEQADETLIEENIGKALSALKDEKQLKIPIRQSSNRCLIKFFNKNRQEGKCEPIAYSDEEEDDEDDDDDESYSCQESDQLKTLRLNEKECASLYLKLALFASDKPRNSSSSEGEREFKRVSPSLKDNQRSNIILSPRNRIYEASMNAYKVWGNGIVNFHSRRDYELLRFCYAYDCGESESSLRYIKNITLTEYKADYAGFEKCAIYRIVKFCPTCFQRHIAIQATQPDEPLLMRINYRAHKLFSLL